MQLINNQLAKTLRNNCKKIAEILGEKNMLAIENS